MKKIRYLFLTLAIGFSLMLPAAAAETDAGTTEEMTTTVTENGTEEPGKAPAEDMPGENLTAGEPEGGTENPFAALFETFGNHASEVFAAVSAFLSLTVFWLFRRGLLPLLRGGLNALSGVAEKMHKESETSSENLGKTADSVNHSLLMSAASIAAMQKMLEGFSEKLNALSVSREEREAMRCILLSQVDMLSEIFLSSALPEYRKELVGEKLTAMRRALGEEKDA